jgi:hypothetical protein
MVGGLEGIVFEDEIESIKLKTEFPDLDNNGVEYADNITECIVEKLKIALGIPDTDTNH